MSWESVQDNWPILAGFVAGIAAWGKTVSTVGQQTKEQERLGVRVTKIENDITSIKESAASMASYAKSTQQVLEVLLKKEIGG